MTSPNIAEWEGFILCPLTPAVWLYAALGNLLVSSASVTLNQKQRRPLTVIRPLLKTPLFLSVTVVSDCWPLHIPSMKSEDIFGMIDAFTKTYDI